MLQTLLDIDRETFLFLNNLHTPALDIGMYWITHKYTWIPLYLFIIYWLIRKHQKESFYLILSILITIACCDIFASSLCKPFFMRFRPCHEPALQNMVHLVAGCGGKYGFISSHAANTFGLATFLFLHWSKEKTMRIALLLMVLWAFLVSYSRIYVGVHYPLDLIVGGISGIIWAFLVYKLYLFWKIKRNIHS